MPSQVDRTQPGSRNDWRITYDTGSQKWTNDRPGDGVGESSKEMLKEEFKDPAVKRGMDSVAKALKSDKGLDKAVADLVRDIGEERSRTLLRAMSQAAERAGAPEQVVKGIEGAREMVAGIKDVVKKIFKVFNVDKAREMVERVTDFWKTKDKRHDLTPQEQRSVYRPVDYSDTLPLTKKRKLNVNWTDHAEYRSDLRDVDPKKVNEAVRDRLKQKLNPPVKDKKNFKEPGVGTMVVDFDTRKNPAEADIVTVWASVRRNMVAAVMERINPEGVKTLWFENEAGQKWYPNLEGNGYPGDVPEGYIYQRSLDTSMKDSILKTVQEDEVANCDHSAEFRVTDHGWVDGMEGERCQQCGGHYVRKVGETEENWEATGSVPVMSGSSGWSDDLALAIANSAGVPLHKAIVIAASACERCMNALAHEHGLDWGYPEMSEDWKKSGTVCEFCEGMGYTGRDRAGLNQFQEEEAQMSDKIAEELARVAGDLTAAATFSIYGMEYPKDSKYAKQMSTYLVSPFQGDFEERMWNAVRDWGKKARASTKDMDAVLLAIDNGAANVVLRHAPQKLSDIMKIAERLGL